MERARPLGPRFEQALVYAANVHGGQLRKGTSTPYLAHLLAVCALVLEDGGDEDEAIAALLHDAVEDQGGRARLADIEERFGRAVAVIVEHCTDTFDSPKPPWRPRKEAYLRSLEPAPRSALRVSLADKLSNVRAILHDLRVSGDAVWERFSASRDEQLWYYGELARLFRERELGPMADELAEVVSQLKAAGASEP